MISKKREVKTKEIIAIALSAMSTSEPSFSNPVDIMQSANTAINN